MLEDHIEGPDPEKPSCLPFSNPDAVAKFDKANSDMFKKVVQYFRWLGGHSIEDAIKSYFNESISPACANKYTMYGTDQSHSLYDPLSGKLSTVR